jgi:hypothetical protein
MNNYRQLTLLELEILHKLLSRPFKGSEEIKKQIENCEVRVIPEYTDNWGSIEFNIHSKVKAEVDSRVPVSADTIDIDNVPINIFLHIVDGFADELEITKADNSPLKGLINPKKLTVILTEDIKKE